MALLFRSGLKKTEDQKQDEHITEEIQLYVQKLLQELPTVQTQYNDFYNARESPELGTYKKSFELRKISVQKLDV